MIKKDQSKRLEGLCSTLDFSYMYNVNTSYITVFNSLFRETLYNDSFNVKCLWCCNPFLCSAISQLNITCHAIKLCLCPFCNSEHLLVLWKKPNKCFRLHSHQIRRCVKSWQSCAVIVQGLGGGSYIIKPDTTHCVMQSIVLFFRLQRHMIDIHGRS